MNVNKNSPWYWKAPWWKCLWLRTTKPFWPIRTIIMYKLTGDCGNACGWVEPYGWVPEAGCLIHDSQPTHDPDTGVASRLLLVILLLALALLQWGCDKTPTPSPTPCLTGTCNPLPTFWPTDLQGPTEWITCTPPEGPTRTPMPTARDVSAWPTCTLFPTLCPLALTIQNACLQANGQPIVLDRNGPIWLQARQMFEACPLGPEVVVVTLFDTYHAQRFKFGYLFYREDAPGELFYMTHLGWEIHAVVPCVNYNVELPNAVHK